LKKQKLLVVINNENQDHHISFAKLSRSYIYGQLQSVRDRLAVEVVISTEHWPDLYGSPRRTIMFLTMYAKEI